MAIEQGKFQLLDKLSYNSLLLVFLLLMSLIPARSRDTVWSP
jgi:hypothetical protein